MIRIGVVNIDISHPRSFANILHKEDRARYVAIYNDGFRTDEEVNAFMKEFSLEKRCSSLEELADTVDIAFIQSCNWDRHLELAKPILARGKPVFIDKPIVGSLKDCFELEDLVKHGARIYGSSSVRYAEEYASFLAMPKAERGKIVSIFTSCGVDEFNYGVHIMEGIQGMLGPGAYSVQFIGGANRDGIYTESYFVKWSNGISVIYQIMTGVWQPFVVSVQTTKGTFNFQVDTTKIYKSMLDKIFDAYDAGTELVPISHLTEAIKIYLAGKSSREKCGAEIKLDALELSDPGFDGFAFEKQYALKQGK
ncbi:Gfo/Idh/MocA family oxidoreductase [candidate division KSB1 bacterium]|nr:Gfo/Idh/MocA family oxidoreductase [candidate division KSB1 bacterium]